MTATQWTQEIFMAHAFASTLKSFTTASGKTGTLYRLPVSIRIVLESVLRNCDGARSRPSMWSNWPNGALRRPQG
jgi:aconitate hydratase